MSQLLIVVFLIEAVVHTVNAVGASTINNLVCSALQRLLVVCIPEDLMRGGITTNALATAMDGPEYLPGPDIEVGGATEESTGRLFEGQGGA
jgi:hypothetical protein